MPTLHITRGLPASGKSTFARAWADEDIDNRAVVTRDDLRSMLHDGEWAQTLEPHVVSVRDATISTLLRRGVDVMAADTNLANSVVKDLLRIAARHSAAVEVHDFTNVPLEECLRRNASRVLALTAVPESVITSMHSKYLRGKPYPLPMPVLPLSQPQSVVPYVPVPGTPKAILVDLDGTLALHNGRDPYAGELCMSDLPNAPVIEAVRMYKHSGYAVIFMTARPARHAALTTRWLQEYVGVWAVSQHVFTRADGDTRKDSVVKLELFNAHIRTRYNVRTVFDDRDSVVAMWRSLGLTVFQVAEGDF